MTQHEALRVARKFIYEHGKIVLVGNRMEPVNKKDLEAAELAQAYNKLAEIHNKIKAA